MIVYGMAFDFFNISGSLFVEKEADSKIRASAQGLFFMMTNGLGAIIGGYATVLLLIIFRNTHLPDRFLAETGQAFGIVLPDML